MRIALLLSTLFFAPACTALIDPPTPSPDGGTGGGDLVVAPPGADLFGMPPCGILDGVPMAGMPKVEWIDTTPKGPQSPGLHAILARSDFGFVTGPNCLEVFYTHIKWDTTTTPAAFRNRLGAWTLENNGAVLDSGAIITPIVDARSGQKNGVFELRGDTHNGQANDEFWVEPSEVTFVIGNDPTEHVTKVNIGSQKLTW